MAGFQAPRAAVGKKDGVFICVGPGKETGLIVQVPSCPLTRVAQDPPSPS